MQWIKKQKQIEVHKIKDRNLRLTNFAEKSHRNLNKHRDKNDFLKISKLHLINSNSCPLVRNVRNLDFKGGKTECRQCTLLCIALNGAGYQQHPGSSASIYVGSFKECINLASLFSSDKSSPYRQTIQKFW